MRAVCRHGFAGGEPFQMWTDTGKKLEDLVALELRQAQHVLGEITGEVSSDDLLGRIFSDFCIGK